MKKVSLFYEKKVQLKCVKYTVIVEMIYHSYLVYDKTRDQSLRIQ